MKQRRKTGSRALASLMLLAVSLTCAFSGNAQITYRGFVEGGLGAAIITGADGYSSGFRDSNNGGGVGFSYMLATTHGIQLKNNFFGIGLGITPGYCAVGDYSYSYDYYDETYSIESLSNSRMSKVSVSAYLNWRYDFFGTDGSFKPYIGIKAGVFIPISEFRMHYRAIASDYSNENFDETYADGIPDLIYASVDFGLRKRLSESSGVSFGLSIQNSNNAKAEYYSYTYPYAALYYDFGINILAKVAFDF